jgi:DinB superfamily
MPHFAVRVALVVLAASASLGAQSKPAEPATLKAVLLRHWNDIGGKVVAMAENFPEDKYEFKPVDGVRTFGDVIRHVGFWNEYVEKTARGEKADDRQNEWPKAQFQNKAQLVAALKRSMEAAAAQLKAGAEPASRAADLWVAFIGHSSEHYGQLVVYYRLNGLVPPASRTQ